jgi:hypothetical protein
LVEIRVKVPRMRKIKGRYFWWPAPAVRRLGFRSEPLGAELSAAIARANFLNAQVETERKAPDPDKPATVRPGSVAQLIRHYRASPKWTKALAEETKKSYGVILDEIERRVGHKSVVGISKVGMVKTYESLQPRGLATANAHMRIWRLLMSYAVKRGIRSDNPASKMELVATKARTTLWTESQVEKFATTAERLGRPSMALAVRLAYEIGQRQTDIRALSYDQWKGNRFELDQSKTSEPVTLKVRPHIAKLLNALKAPEAFVIVAEKTGRPYKRYHFQHEFARIRAAAGLPKHLQFRDIRRTAATETGAGGGTDDEIRSVTGHKTRNIVSTYVVPDTKMADAAHKKRWAGRKPVIAKKGAS